MSQVDTVPKSAAQHSEIVELSDDEETERTILQSSALPRDQRGAMRSNTKHQVIDLASDSSWPNSNAAPEQVIDLDEEQSGSVSSKATSSTNHAIDDAIEHDAQYILAIGSDWRHEQVIALLLANSDNPNRVNLAIEALLECDSATDLTNGNDVVVEAVTTRPSTSKRSAHSFARATSEADDLDMLLEIAERQSSGTFVPEAAINALANQHVYAPACAPSSSYHASGVLFAAAARSNADPGASSSSSHSEPLVAAHAAEYAGLYDRFQADVLTLSGMFPDCDPAFLRSRLEEHFEEAGRMETVVDLLLKTGDYPKLPERKKKEFLNAQKRERLCQVIDFGDFLRTYANPEEHFCDVKGRVAESYKQHARAYLLAVFSHLSPTLVQSVLAEQNFHFLPAFRLLKTRYPDVIFETNRFRSSASAYSFRSNQPSTSRQCGLPKWHDLVKPENMPDTIDEQFYEELLYARYEDDIKAELRNRQVERQYRLNELKQSNSVNWLLTCTICYDEQVFPEDSFTCENQPNEHVFCRDCMRKYVDCEMGQGRYSFCCLTGECNFEFTMRHLSALLPKRLLDRVLDKRLEADLAAVDNSTIVSCPFCSYAVQMDDPNYSEIACANPACLRRSCRFCKEDSHVPLACNEVKRKNVEKEYLEKKLSESVIRVCYRCKKPFVKSDGCNMITCTCGAKQCYVCGAQGIEYSHFGRGKCQQHDMQVDTKRLDEANRRVTDELRSKTVDQLQQALQNNSADSGEQSTVEDTIDAVLQGTRNRARVRVNRRRAQPQAAVPVPVPVPVQPVFAVLPAPLTLVQQVAFFAAAANANGNVNQPMQTEQPWQVQVQAQAQRPITRSSRKRPSNDA